MQLNSTVFPLTPPVRDVVKAIDGLPPQTFKLVEAAHQLIRDAHKRLFDVTDLGSAGDSYAWSANTHMVASLKALRHDALNIPDAVGLLQAAIDDLANARARAPESKQQELGAIRELLRDARGPLTTL